MLLNQCLAISLSPVSSSDLLDGDVEKLSKQRSGSAASVECPKHIPADLFQQLVKQNSRLDELDGLEHAASAFKQRARPDVHRQPLGTELLGQTQAPDDLLVANKRRALCDAIKRIQLAGFVLPTWLLLSGSYNDIHCLKASWSDGIIEPPAGYKIETIGNIRSVNVDYFDLQHQDNQSAEESAAAAADNQDKPTNEHESTVNSLSSRLQDKDRTLPKFAPLEAAILDSLSELSGEGNKKSGVHIGSLIQSLNSRYSHSIDSPAIEFVDCAINGLVRGGQVKLRPLGQEQMEGGLLLEQRGACQSVFIDQLIELAQRQDPATINANDGWRREQSPSRLAAASNAENKCNKSAFVDTGIQSWLMVNRTASSSSSSGCCGSSNATCSNMSPTSGEDDQLQQQQQQQQQQARASRPRKIGEQVVGQQQRRGFSLARSLSFGPKKSTLLQQRQQTIAGDCRWSGREQASELRPAAPQEPRQAASNLSSLFRSKSMRIISSGKGDRFKSGKNHDVNNNSGNNTNNHGSYTKFICDLATRGDAPSTKKPITIDYLATAQPHKRSLSLRRNSLLSFSNSNSSGNNNNTSSSKEDSSASGKLVLFLRKLFTGRRSRSVAAPGRARFNYSDVEREITRHPPCQVDTEIYGELQRSNLTDSGADDHNRNHLLRRHQTLTARSVPRNQAAPSSSPANGHDSACNSSPTSSSGSNSLIEILDYSPAVDNSRRPLRREAVDTKARFNRAQWRVIKRSESNLSHDSEASCSTTKSTASQQLRKHLDEAYKRHRKCTNQREKDFIDSINVLRQASRHALQNSRSSSKSRQAKSSGTKSATSEDTASSFGSSYCPSAARADEQQLSPKSGHNPLAYRSLVYPSEEPVYAHNSQHFEDSTVQPNYRSQELDLIHQCRSLEIAKIQADDKPLQPEWNHGVQAGEQRISCGSMMNAAATGLHGCSSGGACCLCNSYLDAAARLTSCPLATCFPSSAAASGDSFASPCCCLAPQTVQQQNDKLTSNLRYHPSQSDELMPQSALASHHNPLTASGGPTDFCCPVWRSLLYNYCQTPFCAPPPPQSLMHQQQQQQHQVVGSNTTIMDIGGCGGGANQRLVDNYSRQQQIQQQHQHNTTIDLKIEIGADFNPSDKLTKQVPASARQASGGGRGRKQRRELALRSLKRLEEPEGEVDDEWKVAEAEDSLAELTSSSLASSGCGNETLADETETTSPSDDSLTATSAAMMASDNIIKMDRSNDADYDDELADAAITTTFGSCCDAASNNSPPPPPSVTGKSRDSLQSEDDDSRLEEHQ